MKHYYQPNNFACVQTATAIFLSHYGIERTPEDIISEVPVRSWPGKDEPAGTPNQDICIYLLGLDFEVEIISQDLWVTDLDWQGKDAAFITSRLKAASGKLTAPMIERDGTELYIQAYLDFIKAGGELRVEPVVTSARLKTLLKDGPLMTSVAYGTLHGVGKHVNMPNGQSKQDDIKGIAPNHNIVISQYENSTFEIYDPWLSPGIFKIPSDRLIAAIATAQQQCDNMVIVARKKR